MANIELIHGDCMEGMANMKDKEYDLAIVDPPYGIDMDGNKGDSKNFFRQYEDKGWDLSTPNAKYFLELFRVSKNQIIWGGNYFLNYLEATPCMLIWDKTQRDFSFADAEIAWTSFQSSVRIFTQNRNFLHLEDKIHPTQKPVKLYEWLLKNYAKEGDRILDTHGGSMSIAIACYNLDFDLTLFELDEDYYKAGIARFEEHKRQQRLFP